MYRSPTRFTAPAGCPFTDPSEVANAAKSQRRGSTKLMDRLEKRNARNMHLKKKKKDLTEKEKRDRAKAMATAVVFESLGDDRDALGRQIAMATGVGPSQISQYVEGKIADLDGDRFQSQSALDMMRRLKVDELKARRMRRMNNFMMNNCMTIRQAQSMAYDI